MRFLSLALLSGCALFDATGDPKGGDNTPARFTFETGIIVGLANVQAASIGQLDTSTADLDVAVLAGDTIVLCKNQGAGQFGTGLSMGVGYTLIAVDDLDGDGAAEIIAAGEGGKLDVFVPNGSNGFDPTSLAAHTLGSPRKLATGSFPPLETQSPRRAIVISYNDANEMRVIARLLDAPASVMVTPFQLPNQTEDIVIADVASEGADSDEIIVPMMGSARVILELSVQAPTVLTERVLLDQSFAPSIAAGELGATEEHDDVVFVSRAASGPSSLRTKLGSQTGLTSDGPQLGLGSNPIDVAAGDIDGDGQDEIIALVSNNDARALHVFSRGIGQDFTDPEVVSLTGTPDHIVVGNLNNDAKADLLVFPNSTSGVDVLLSR